MNSYQNLISKLNIFIKKYYKVKILRGILIFITLFPFVWLLISYSEFYLRFSVLTRAIILYAFIAFFLFVFFSFIVIPFLKLLKIGKRISYHQASEIISKYFFEVKDKLQNILELYKQDKKHENVLIEAAISQKSEKLKLIPFSSAISYKQLLKYLKYTVPVLLIFISAFLISPVIFKESTKHIINYKEEFKLPPPFYFQLKNNNLNYKKGESVKIKLKVKGDYLPNEVFINYGGSNFFMSKEKNSKSEFLYEFKNLYNSVDFRFSADNIHSKKYRVNILPSPSILQFYLNINVPEYTGEKDTILKNANDIVIPFGSVVSWTFIPDHVDSLLLISKNEIINTQKTKNKFLYHKRYFKNKDYYLTTVNKYFRNEKFLHFNVNVIPDLYPAIQVEQLKDTANFFISYFKGFINDDYGIKKLNFKFRVINNTVTNSKSKQQFITNNLPINKSELKQTFYYSFNFNNLNPKENQKVEYYFEVWDNDAVSGSKKTKTQIFTFNIPSTHKIDSLENSANENINSKLDKSLNLADEIKKDLQNLREKNLNGNVSEWENKQMLQNILNKQDLLKKMTDEIAQENKEKNKISHQFNKQDEELIKKQEEIQKLLDEVMTDELKELMKQLEELQNKFNQKMMDKLLKENEFSYKEMSERLDRTKELLKREQTEQKINKAINKLNKLSKKQKDLANQTKEKTLTKDELLNKQKDISDKFKDAMKEYDEEKKLNEELKNKMKLDDFEKEKQEINQEFQKSEENLSKGKKNKASDSQSKNSKNMKKMADAMDSMMQANSAEQQSEDTEALRKILDNLLNFSFKQENLINEFKTIKNSNPKMMTLFEKQSNMKEDFQIINDSLKALAYRVPQINKPITTELSEILQNLKDAKTKLQDRKTASASVNQNKVMTSANNLALLLSQILNQMKNAQQSGGSGKGSKNPKNGKQKAMQDLKGIQESLKQQMEQMLKQMKNGEGSFNQNAMNKQLAKMLAQQEIFKQMLKEMQSGFSLNSETQKLLNEINKMNDENKKKIINRQITPELLERQKKIETRLLEAEKAENKRKFDKKREAENPNGKIYKSPKDVFKNTEDKTYFNEDLYKKNIQLKNFYKKLYNDYSKTINK
ncbi:MAG: hypothetical protein DRI94_05745 [Bacteroidetes bacterium]|nr:MAG: hypothetical protein DRI94_05745 [Bacteroidota bacterium]